MVMRVTENKAVTFDAIRQFTCVFAPVHTCDNSPASTSFSFSNDDTWELKSSIFKTHTVLYAIKTKTCQLGLKINRNEI